MKTLKQIREQYDQITEKDENEERKLTTLVRSGLVDTNKLPLIKRALNKDNRVLTPSERNALMSLLDSLMAQVLHSSPVYQKVKQNVMKEELRPATTRMSDMPSILVLKRKAIRVYPGGQNVGLYYSQQLDKYVAVPFGGSENKNIISMTEEQQLDEISNQLATKVYSRRMAQADNEDETDAERSIAKYKAGKTLVNRIAKSGLPAAIRMDAKAKKFSARYKSMKKAKKDREAAANATPPKPSEPKKPYVDKNVMGSSVMADALKHRSVAHVIGGIGYRMMNKNKMNEETLDEALPALAAPLIGAGLRAAGSAALRYGPRIAGAIKNLVKGKKTPKGSRKRPSKEDRLKNLDKNRNRNRNNRKSDKDIEVNNNDTGTGNNNDSTTNTSVPVKTSPTGSSSKLRVSVNNSFDTHRKRQSDLSWSQPNQPQRQQQGMRESVVLDGNTFELNSSVAKKVQSVYESLNKKNKKKMVELMNESEESFNKVISFVVRH